MPLYKSEGAILDVAKLVRDITAALRKDSDGGTTITGKELVKILGDAGVVVIDLVGVVL